VAGADLLWKKSNADWLVASANLMWEKNIAGWLADKPSEQSVVGIYFGTLNYYYDAEDQFPR